MRTTHGGLSFSTVFCQAVKMTVDESKNYSDLSNLLLSSQWKKNNAPSILVKTKAWSHLSKAIPSYISSQKKSFVLQRWYLVFFFKEIKAKIY